MGSWNPYRISPLPRLFPLTHWLKSLSLFLLQFLLSMAFPDALYHPSSSWTCVLLSLMCSDSAPDSFCFPSEFWYLRSTLTPLPALPNHLCFDPFYSLYKIYIFWDLWIELLASTIWFSPMSKVNFICYPPSCRTFICWYSVIPAWLMYVFFMQKPSQWPL